MKKVFLAICLLFSIAAFSQIEDKQLDSINSVQAIDSSSLKLNVTFKGKYHLDIIQAMKLSGLLSEPESANYYNQVMSQVDSVYSVALEQIITVNVTSSLIVKTYQLMGVQQERVVAEVNAEMKTALLPQVASHTWIMRQIIHIASLNAALTSNGRQSAFNHIQATKQ